MNIKFVCLGERKVIGGIGLETIEHLNSQSIWREFVPVSTEYQLPTSIPRDGQYMLCPRCNAHVSIEQAGYVINETMQAGPKVAPMTREDCRRGIVSNNQAHEYISSDNLELDRPLILGASRIAKR